MSKNLGARQEQEDANFDQLFESIYLEESQENEAIKSKNSNPFLQNPTKKSPFNDTKTKPQE